MAHARRIHKKSFIICSHRGFGKVCHICNPNPPLDKVKALQGEYGPKVQEKQRALEKKQSRKKGKK